MDTDDLVTIQEAAAALGVTDANIRQAILDGRLPHIIKYGRKLVATRDLEAYRLRTQPDGQKRVGRPKKEG